MRVSLHICAYQSALVWSDRLRSPIDAGARQAQGIVDAAMSTLKTMVADRLKGGKKSGGGGSKSGGGGGGSQVRYCVCRVCEYAPPCLLHFNSHKM